MEHINKEKVLKWEYLISKKYKIEFEKIELPEKILLKNFKDFKREVYNHIVLNTDFIKTTEMITFKNCFYDIVDFIKLDNWLNSQLTFKGIYSYSLSGK